VKSNCVATMIATGDLIHVIRAQATQSKAAYPGTAGL